MPRYEYHCDACNADFEAQQRMSDDPLTTCTQCGQEGQVRRLVGAGTGLIFKGSGFYITDYRNGNGSSGGSKDSSSSESSSNERSSKETKAESGKTESKKSEGTSSSSSSSSSSSE